MTELEIVKRQLLAIRDLVDTTLGILGAADTLDDEHGTCAHPKEERIAAAVMSNPTRFFCKRCNSFVPPDQPAAPPAEPAPALTSTGDAGA